MAAAMEEGRGPKRGPCANTPESGSSDDESHDVNHADNRLASAQRSCLEAGVKHVSTPTIKGGSKKLR